MSKFRLAHSHLFYSFCFPLIKNPLLLFFIFYLLALQKDYTIYYLFSILCAYTLTYMKEPGFIIFLPILFLKGLLNWKTCTRKEKIFYALLFLNCIIFIIAYVLCTYTPGKNYASGISAFTLFDNIKYVLSFSYYLILNMLILLIRLIGYLKTKDKLCFIKIHDIKQYRVCMFIFHFKSQCKILFFPFICAIFYRLRWIYL